MSWQCRMSLAAVAVCTLGNLPLVAQTPPSPKAAEESEPAELELLPGPPIPAPTQPRPRATLGVHVVPGTATRLSQYGLAVTQGALIAAILPGSPADRSGLPLGGVIVAVDGQSVDSPEGLLRIVSTARPDQKIELKYYQAGRLFRKSVQLVPSPSPSPSAEQPMATALPQPPTVRGERPGLLDGTGRWTDEFVPSPGIPELLARQTQASDAITALRKQLDSLQQQVLQLQRKLAELEQRITRSASN